MGEFARPRIGDTILTEIVSGPHVVSAVRTATFLIDEASNELVSAQIVADLRARFGETFMRTGWCVESSTLHRRIYSDEIQSIKRWDEK